LPDEKDLVKAGVEGAVAGAMQGTGFKELVQQFLEPLASEAGTGLGYVGTVFRVKIGLLMMAKARKMLADADIEPRAEGGVRPPYSVLLVRNVSFEGESTRPRSPSCSSSKKKSCMAV
jgi:hypothetical protein